MKRRILAGTIMVLGVSIVGIGAGARAANATKPTAPKIGTAYAGNAAAGVTFAPPASNGGSPVTSYRAICASSNGGVAGVSPWVTKSPATVTKLTNAKVYVCRVVARNAIGTSPASAPSRWVLTGVPVQIPSPPSHVQIVAPGTNLTAVLRTLRAGNILLLRGGTYVQNVQVTLSPGSVAAPIVVAAYPGERPVVKGTFWMTSPTHYTFSGINVTWNPATDTSSEQMVKLTNGAGWTFENAEVWGAHSYADLLVAGTVAGQPANWTVQNNCIHDTFPTNDLNQDHLIYANTGSTAGAGRIARNLLFNATNGMGVKIGGAEPGQGSAGITVDHNTIYNTSQSVLVAWASHDNLVTGNIMSLVGPNNGNVRGFELTGTDNDAKQNVGFDARSLILNFDGGNGVTNAGGNQFPVNPEFNNTTSCSGFHTSNPAVQTYGRWGS